MSVEQLPAEDAAPSGRYDGVLRYYELAKRAEWKVGDLQWGDDPADPGGPRLGREACTQA